MIMRCDTLADVVHAAESRWTVLLFAGYFPPNKNLMMCQTLFNLLICWN